LKKLILLITTALLVLVIVRYLPAKQQTLPLPVLPEGPVVLRVAYVVNPRLPKMSNEQLKILLTATQKTARDHFGIDIHFTPVVEIPIETLFHEIPESARLNAARHIYDFKKNQGNLYHLINAFSKGLRQSDEPLAAMINYAQPYMKEPIENSYESLGNALARIQLERIKQWQSVKALDGKSVIDESTYNEYMMWDALSYGNMPYELVLTNQIIASTEDIDPAVHTAIRGGYCNGVTFYNKQSRYGTYSVWSTFAFSSDKELKQIRSGEAYSPEEAAKLAGIGATHEIGHQLFHFQHPYGNTACVMNPVPMFNYRSWTNKLSPKDCEIGSSPAMVAGSNKFTIH